MINKLFLSFFVLVLVLFLSGNVLAYETYDISESELESGYTQSLSPGDKINFPMGPNTGYVSVLSVYVNAAGMSIFAQGTKDFYTEEHPNIGIFPSEQIFEMTEDNYYDLRVTLNSAIINEDNTRVASITIKKINEEIPESTEIYYDCWKYYECSDGTRIKYCDYSGQVCACRSVSSSECPQEDDDGDQEPDDQSATTFFKNCNYIWDSTPYIGQTIKITASIKDISGSTDRDSVNISVVESVSSEIGGGYPMDGKTLDIQIIEPRSNEVAGAVEIKINSKGPNELGEMFLGLSGDIWGAGFPISNRNCVVGESGGGGPIESICEKYHVCENGSEIQYCKIIKQYDDNGNVIGAGCVCKQNPEELCTSSGPSGGGDQPIEIPSTGGGGGNNETPIICNGCVLGDKCVPISYRTKDKYCNIENEFVQQQKTKLTCNNNFECKSNVCVNDECISGSLIKKIIDWLKKLFGIG